MLLRTAVKFENEAKELKKEFMKMITLDDIQDMDEKTIITLKNFFKFIDTSVELMQAQTAMIDLIDKKLDQLLEKN